MKVLIDHVPPKGRIASPAASAPAAAAGRQHEPCQRCGATRTPVWRPAVFGGAHDFASGADDLWITHYSFKHASMHVDMLNTDHRHQSISVKVRRCHRVPHHAADVFATCSCSMQQLTDRALYRCNRPQAPKSCATRAASRGTRCAPSTARPTASPCARQAPRWPRPPGRQRRCPWRRCRRRRRCSSRRRCRRLRRWTQTAVQSCLLPQAQRPLRQVPHSARLAAPGPWRAPALRR